MIALMAMDNLRQEEIYERIHFHTAATPLFGYKAPKVAAIGIPFVGKGNINLFDDKSHGLIIYRVLSEIMNVTAP